MKLLFLLMLFAVPLASASAREAAPAVTPGQAPPAPTATPAAKPSPSASVTVPAKASPPPLSRRQLVDGLSNDEIQAAIQALQKLYLDPGIVADDNLRRAALEGILVRLGPGVSLLPAKPIPSAPQPFPFLSEILDSHIGYIRPGSLDKAALGQFDAALKSFSEKSFDALILDLRSVSTPGEFETAAEFARRLSPRGKVLFTLQKPSAKQERMFTSGENPDFHGQIVVLIDSGTSGPAEALAAALRSATGALILGSDSAGAAFEFEVLPLGPSSRVRLQVAVSQVLIPNSGALFPDGLKPDIAVALPSEIQNRIFRESSEKGVSQFVFEPERRHMNEASLVANTNPEIDVTQSAAKHRAPASPSDTVLQRAVDLITAIQFYEKKSSPR